MNWSEPRDWLFLLECPQHIPPLTQLSLEAKVRTDRLNGASLYHRGQGI